MSLFITFIYQPFFNLLVGFYYMLGLIPDMQPDMGLAVILLTITIRVLLLPLSIASTRSRKERHDIQHAIVKIQNNSQLSPDESKQRIKTTFKANRRILVSEAINFFIQLMIFFVLYRIFTTGLKGADIHLIYTFMPPISPPFNMVFLGRFDLTHPSFVLNLIQSLVIVAVEVLDLIDSPYPVRREEFIRYVIVLPIASFLMFMFLPAGKKLFIITTLLFSFFFILTNVLSRFFADFFAKVDESQVKKIEKHAQRDQEKSSTKIASQA